MSNPLTNAKFYKAIWTLAKIAGKEIGNVWTIYRNHPGGISD